MKQLVYLKLGGSLITDKNKPHTAKPDVIRYLAAEIKSALKTNPDLRLLLGHGSGSFGHVPASKYHTRLGVHTAVEWQGFAEVWAEAHALNEIVVKQFIQTGLPVISFPPSAALSADNSTLFQWNTAPIASALENGLLPIVFGDVIFDNALGGTIFSTEQLFSILAHRIQPERILIAGSEAGVWSDFPARTKLVSEIKTSEYQEHSKKIFPSSAVDVTGGMASKVNHMVNLVSEIPSLQVVIFNPLLPGSLERALRGETVGTLIHQ